MDHRSTHGESGKAVGVALGAALLLSFCAGAWSSETVWAQAGEQDVKRVYQTGKITAVKGNTIYIDGKPYGLREDAQITDDRGNPKERDAIQVDVDVEFRLVRDSIAHLKIILPR